MCPTFRITHQEAAAPRAKANLLRRLLAPDQAVPLGANDVRAVADLCINCKMCAHECPAHVNIPKLMLEAKAANQAEQGLDRSDWALARSEAVAALLKDRRDALVVTGLGSSSYDVHAVGDHAGNYYLWGAMGGAVLVGLGLAQAQPQRRVLVITGDGEQLMAFGSLATIAVAKPCNLDIVVLDNEHYGETGMQQSHTGRGIELGVCVTTTPARVIAGMSTAS